MRGLFLRSLIAVRRVTTFWSIQSAQTFLDKTNPFFLQRREEAESIDAETQRLLRGLCSFVPDLMHGCDFILVWSMVFNEYHTWTVVSNVLDCEQCMRLHCGFQSIDDIVCYCINYLGRTWNERLSWFTGQNLYTPILFVQSPRRWHFPKSSWSRNQYLVF